MTLPGFAAPPNFPVLPRFPLPPAAARAAATAPA